MPRLIWSPPALADVQRLYRFLALKDEDAARRAIKTLRAGVKILAHQPEAGRPVEAEPRSSRMSRMKRVELGAERATVYSYYILIDIFRVRR